MKFNKSLVVKTIILILVIGVFSYFQYRNLQLLKINSETDINPKTENTDQKELEVKNNNSQDKLVTSANLIYPYK